MIIDVTIILMIRIIMIMLVRYGNLTLSTGFFSHPSRSENHSGRQTLGRNWWLGLRWQWSWLWWLRWRWTWGQWFQNYVPVREPQRPTPARSWWLGWRWQLWWHQLNYWWWWKADTLNPFRNKLASLEAMLVRNYSPTTDPLTGVECRATGVAENSIGKPSCMGDIYLQCQLKTPHFSFAGSCCSSGTGGNHWKYSRHPFGTCLIINNIINDALVDDSWFISHRQHSTICC